MNKLYKLITPIFIYLVSIAETTVYNSCKEEVHQTISCKLSDFRIPKSHRTNINRALKRNSESIKFMSYNILFSCQEEDTEESYKWEKRKERLVSIIEHWAPDLVALQEPQEEQLTFLQKALPDYTVVGIDSYPINFTNAINEKNGFLVRKDRLSITAFDVIPYKQSANYFTHISCKDLKTGRDFHCVNAHLSFRDPNMRLLEAKELAEFSEEHVHGPICIMGDFNTFPMQFENDYPFYDGPLVERLLTKGGKLSDAKQAALLGHFGACSTTNYCNKSKKPFIGDATSHVFLDHIFCSEEFTPIYHAIDFVNVDGFQASDHLPVIIEVIIE